MNADIPPQAGSYALLLSLDREVQLGIGRMGEFDFPAGDYVYLGGAHGPGGLRARLRHHLRGNSRPHWHIDYLRTAAHIRGIVYRVSAETLLECAWTQRLVQAGGVCSIMGFGASDCTQGCGAHLIYFARQVSEEWVREAAGI